MFADLFFYAAVIGVTVLVYRVIYTINAAYKQARRQEEEAGGGHPGDR